MLLQFVLENFRSFHAEEILNMIPAKSRIHDRHVLRSESKGRKVRALPLAILYGANASGKSNLIDAIAFARTLIVHGTRSEQSTGTVPFRLGANTAEAPSRFEFVLKHDGVLYTYGFAITTHEVKEEWLFAVFLRQEVRLFERLTEAGKARVEFGAKLAPTKSEKRRLEFVAAGTRSNQLFLTEANERNVDLLKPLMSWFRDHLTVVRPDAAYQPLVLRAQTDVQFKEFLSQFLGIADTGIQGIDLEAEELDFSRHFPAMSEPERKSLLDELGRDPNHYLFFRAGKTVWGLRQEPGQAAQVLRLRTRHKTSDGRQVLFEARDESDGTHRMMHLAPALLDLQCAEHVYVIDELDRSLHPHLCRLYVDAFLRGVSEKGHCGQMILTTHETSLLDLDLLRRDEIWFVEKDKQGASHLTSLAEFKYKVRADLKIARGYLNGRFGAIPFIGDARKLLSSSGHPCS